MDKCIVWFRVQGLGTVENHMEQKMGKEVESGFAWSIEFHVGKSEHLKSPYHSPVIFTYASVFMPQHIFEIL